ncbi:hypothetical protein [Roseateles sp. BYS87W]|uniref:Cyclic nucleotide-binding domain-containing protein n=1 Tax=Pelomonas baiyunensis TaxID=3299026 RepID=A0ABW7GZW7_9BURK
MRFAAHVDALRIIFEGGAHPTAFAYVNSGRAAVTPQIISDYQGTLAGNKYFQTWIQYFQAHGRFQICSVNDAPKVFTAFAAPAVDYGAAAYFSGGILFHDPTAPSAGTIGALAALGLIHLDPRAAPPEESQGDNPILTLLLDSAKHFHPSVLDKYILPEDKIVIYDKYINLKSMHFLERIAGIMRPGSSLHIRTTDLGANCFNDAQIASHLQPINPAITIDCQLVTVAFRQAHHDRYIFLGDRMQIELTAGLESFGLPDATGQYANKKSKIILYVLQNWRLLTIPDMNGGSIMVREAV